LEPGANDYVKTFAISPDGATIYVGGLFGTIGGASRSKIAALSASTGLATSWNPGANGEVLTVITNPGGNIIYAVGQFTTIGGSARNYVAALNSVTASSTAWNPGASDMANDVSLGQVIKP
jgi:hypothetical protein